MWRVLTQKPSPFPASIRTCFWLQAPSCQDGKTFTPELRLTPTQGCPRTRKPCHMLWQIMQWNGMPWQMDCWTKFSIEGPFITKSNTKRTNVRLVWNPPNQSTLRRKGPFVLRRAFSQSQPLVRSQIGMSSLLEVPAAGVGSGIGTWTGTWCSRSHCSATATGSTPYASKRTPWLWPTPARTRRQFRDHSKFHPEGLIFLRLSSPRG